MNASDYKQMTGLSQTTALIGEKFRAKLISAGQERFKNLRPHTSHSEETKKKISETLKKNVREKQNIHGTCPLQLITRLQKKAEELGRCPSSDEITFRETLRKNFGTFRNACIEAGLTPLKIGRTHKRTKYTEDFFFPHIQSFWITHGRFPTSKELGNILGAGARDRFVKVRKSVYKKVLYGSGVFQKTPVVVHYSKSELLEMIKNFKKVNGRNPSTSDCKRGLLPHSSRFYHHFGSLKKAIDLI